METRSTSEIEQSTEKLLRDLKEVVRDGEALLKAGADDLNERGSAAREKLSSALAAARETQRKLQDRIFEGARNTDEYLQDHLYQALGIALGLGVFIGVLVVRR
jgi:ElaB/YqjD/DUF883 family membrane-anchored ribosome-binding protein